MTHTPEPMVNTSVSDRINMCLIACAGMDDPVAEIEKLRTQVSADNLYKIFSEFYKVNEYRSGWVGDWPEIQFFLHEIWKRDPNVEQLRANQKVLVDALESLRRKHSVCEDSFYSCPKADPEDYIDCGRNQTECNCWADEHNKRIDEALARVKENADD